jgi:hypothetical protein
MCISLGCTSALTNKTFRKCNSLANISMRAMFIMAIRVVEFSNRGYKIKKVFEIIELKSWLNFDAIIVFY